MEFLFFENKSFFRPSNTHTKFGLEIASFFSAFSAFFLLFSAFFLLFILYINLYFTLKYFYYTNYIHLKNNN